jgi:hypothetical protein
VIITIIYLPVGGGELSLQIFDEAKKLAMEKEEINIFTMSLSKQLRYFMALTLCSIVIKTFFIVKNA